MSWIGINEREPSHGDIINIAGTRNGFKFVSLCKVNKEHRNGGIWMDAVEFGGHDFEYDFEWRHVDAWQLAPFHPDTALNNGL